MTDRWNRNGFSVTQVMENGKVWTHVHENETSMLQEVKLCARLPATRLLVVSIHRGAEE